MTTRIGPKGQVVIPKRVRDEANLQPGDTVDVELRGEEVVIVARAPAGRLGGRFNGSNMAQRLLEDRRREPR